MLSEPTSTGGAPALTARAVWRTVRRQLAYLATTLAVLVVGALGLSTVASGLQAGRDDARSADVAIVVAPTVPSEALVERSFDLYRRNYAPQLVLIGAGGEGLRVALLERGVAETLIVMVAAEGGEMAQLRLAATTARAAGAGSVVIAGDGVAMLRWMKAARDAGLRPYAAPTAGPVPNPIELLQAGVSYWRYALLGS